MHECFHCGMSTVIWDADFSFEDYGEDGEGIIYECHCTNCGARITYCIALDGAEYKAICDLLNRLQQIEVVDAETVVRCRDCKHYQYGVMFPDIKLCCRLKNSVGETVRYNWSDNDYCSYGERKEG